MIDKKGLRSQVRQLKKQLSEEEAMEKSMIIMTQLEDHAYFKIAKTVLIYWSLPDEVYTHNFINKWWTNKTILLPSVHGDLLKIRQFTGEHSLKPGELKGILEPTGPEYKATEPIDLIVVPGMSFDKRNYRMGRGRGFYDRLLENNRSKKIGICFDFQIFETIPIESHDIPMDALIWA
jgi:5-formyltetrahydrofolate cyclo-ligase